MSRARPETGLWPPVVIEPSKGWRDLGLAELREYGELGGMLLRRDLRVRYNQAVIGAAWALLQPLLLAGVFTLIFGMLVRVPSGDVPYAVFVLSGLLVWQIVAKCLSDGSTSLVSNQALLTKVYFPRLLMPILPAGTAVVDFLCSLPALLVVMFWFGVTPSWAMLWLPAFVALAVLCGTTVAIWLSALDVEYRDVRFLLTPFTMLWMYATPIIYPAELVPEAWRGLYALNPLVGAVEGFRWAMLGGLAPPPAVGPTLLSLAVVLALLLGGLANFARMERSFADRV